MATKADFFKLLKQIPQDTSTLTEEQINDHLAKLQQLSQDSAGYDAGGIYDTLTQRLKDYNVRSADIPTVAGSLRDFIVSNKRYPTAAEAIGLLPGDWQRDGGYNSPIINALNDQTLRNEIISKIEGGSFNNLPPEADQMIADLTGLLNQKVEKRKTEEGVNKYLTGLPAENEKQISEFEKSLQESQSEFFGNTLASQIVQAMNARGLSSSGDLADSLTSASAGLQRDIKNTVAPIRLQANQDVANKKYENLLRGALEQGQSLSSAVNFTRNLYSQDLQNQFTASQASIDRAMQQEQFNQQMALQLAMANAGSKSPSALDYFLGYGLPVLGQIGGAFLGGPAGAAIGGSLAGAGGKALSSNINSGGGLMSGSGFIPRTFSSYGSGTTRRY